MSVKIADLVHKLITPDMVSTASRVLGEEPGAVSRGMGAAVTSLLHGIEDRSHDDGAMAAIADMANTVARDQSGLSDIKALLTSGAMPSPASLAGSRLLGSTFGVEQASLTDLVAHVSGLRATSAASLLSLAAPNVLTAVGARLGGGVVDGPSLASLVRQNADEFKGVFLPAGAGSLAGDTAGSVAAAGSSASGGTVSTASAAPRTGGVRGSVLDADSTTVTRGVGAAQVGPQPRSASTGLFTFLTILGVPALIVGGLYWLQINPAPSAPQVTVTEAPAAAPSPSPAPAPAPAAAPQPAATPVLPAGMARIALAGGGEIQAAAEGVETKIIGFITNPDAEIDKGLWFDFDRLTFETGSIALTAESKAQIANIVAILNAYPAVQLKIGGYTDNVGNRASNLVLSDKRARTVRDAIVAGGIDLKRVDAEGYGDKHPIADNATADGRAKNRRTAVSVRAK